MYSVSISTILSKRVGDEVVIYKVVTAKCTCCGNVLSQTERVIKRLPLKEYEETVKRMTAMLENIW